MNCEYEERVREHCGLTDSNVESICTPEGSFLYSSSLLPNQTFDSFEELENAVFLHKFQADITYPNTDNVLEWLRDVNEIVNRKGAYRVFLGLWDGDEIFRLKVQNRRGAGGAIVLDTRAASLEQITKNLILWVFK